MPVHVGKGFDSVEHNPSVVRQSGDLEIDIGQRKNGIGVAPRVT